VNPKLTYVVAELLPNPESTAEISGDGKKLKVGNVLKSGEKKLFLIAASELVPKLESKWGVKISVRRTFPGSALEHIRYCSPLLH
jgi:isoleucyl-tRNA synthetase